MAHSRKEGDAFVVAVKCKFGEGQMMGVLVVGLTDCKEKLMRGRL